MTHARRALRAVAVVWLVAQTATLAAVPVTFWIETQAAGVGECTCVHGADATCPMHHRTTNSALCVMQNATNPDACMLNALLGVAGCPPSPVSDLIDPLVSERVGGDGPPAPSRHTPPDPPPPRI